MKPCPNPNCRNEDSIKIIEVPPGFYCVACPLCGLGGPVAQTEDEALEVWEELPR